MKELYKFHSHKTIRKLKDRKLAKEFWTLRENPEFYLLLLQVIVRDTVEAKGKSAW